MEFIILKIDNAILAKTDTAIILDIVIVHKNTPNGARNDSKRIGNTFE